MTDRQPAPRWVRVLGIVAIAAVLVIAVLQLFGGGGHGLARHLPAEVMVVLAP